LPKPIALLFLQAMMRVWLLVLLSGFCLCFESKAQKTDSLFMLDGNVMRGELKSLEFGKLKYKTDYAGTIYVDWEDIVTIKSEKFIEIQLRSGIQIFGSIYPSDTGKIIVQKVLGRDTLELFQIVSFTPIRQTFWSRIDGNIELGGSYTKASEVAQLNGQFNAEYRGRGFVTGVRSNAILTSQPDRDNNQRGDASLYFTDMFKNNWFGTGSITGERNTELGLDWRMLSGGGAGHDFIRKVYSRFSGMVGVFYNGEKAIDSSFITSSVEGALVLTYRKLKYNSPKVDLYTQAALFPSLTESDRVRFQYDLKTRFEIIADFYISANFYFTYDSKPRSETASNEDYGIIGAIGYTF
jgi:hypothetical protein